MPGTELPLILNTCLGGTCLVPQISTATSLLWCIGAHDKMLWVPGVLEFSWVVQVYHGYPLACAALG
jgi:hypothetical protein